MATVVDASRSSGRLPFSTNGVLMGEPNKTGTLTKWILYAFILVGCVTLAVLVVSITTLVLLGRYQLTALLRGSTDLLSYSPESPPGYKYGGFILTGYRTWVEKTPMLVPRSDHSVVFCSDQFFIIGGQSNATYYSNSTTRYDPVFETLTLMRPMLNPRTRMPIGCLNDNTIIVAGGYDTWDNNNNGVPLGTTHLYDIVGNTWTATTPMITPRSDSWGAVVNGIFYFIGGYEAGYAVSNKVEAFDGTTWKSLAPMPSARGDVGIAVMGGLIYAVGGWDNDFSAACEAYNPATNTWTKLAAMPAPHGDNAVVVHQNVLHSIGGEMFSGKDGPCSYDPTMQCAINQIPSNDHFVYDEIHDFWVEGQPLQTSRFRFAAADDGNSLWIFGGATANLEDLALVESLYNTDSSYEDPLYYHIQN